MNVSGHIERGLQFRKTKRERIGMSDGSACAGEKRSNEVSFAGSIDTMK